MEICRRKRRRRRQSTAAAAARMTSDDGDRRATAAAAAALLVRPTADVSRPREPGCGLHGLDRRSPMESSADAVAGGVRRPDNALDDSAAVRQTQQTTHEISSCRRRRRRRCFCLIVVTRELPRPSTPFQPYPLRQYRADGTQTLRTNVEPIRY